MEHGALVSDASELARARERFLQVETIEPQGVRQAILASWWRSRDSNVAADRLDLQYVRDPNLDTPLTRSAEPVLRHLREQLDGQPLSIVLTDPTGVVLSRLTADKDLERHLDKVHLAVGFSYAEGVVGTNGIGTALEAGRAMQVFGHEHYAEHLEDLACAGVPIRHPLSGKTVGVLDLTCWRRDAGPLLVTLAKTTADQIRQALLTETGMREIELLHAYLRACRHTAGMVFALNNDVVMMNETARSTLEAGDQAALLRHAAEALSSQREAAVVELPSGAHVRLHTRPVQGSGRVSGGVIEARIVESSSSQISSMAPARPSGPRMLLPGLVGSGALWRRACSEAETVCRSGGWLVLEGEPGVGKAALLRAVHQRVDPTGRSSVLEAPMVPDSGWLTRARQAVEGEGTIVLSHLERLSGPATRLLAAALQEAAREERAWVAVTLSPGQPGAELARLLRMFPTTVQVPPLRHHIEDVEQLVAFLLLRLGDGGRLSCSPRSSRCCCATTGPATSPSCSTRCAGCSATAVAVSCSRATCPPRSSRSAVTGSARWSRWSATPSCWR